MGQETQVVGMGMGVQGSLERAEVLSTHELNLLLNVVALDRKTSDFLEGAVSGVDLTERRALIATLTLKLRVMLQQAVARERRALEEQAQAAQPQPAPQPQPPLDAPPPPLEVPPGDPQPYSSPEVGG